MRSRRGQDSPSFACTLFLKMCSTDKAGWGVTRHHIARASQQVTGGGCRWKHLPLLPPGILLTKAHSASYSGLARRLSLSLRCCAAWKVRMVMKHVQARISNGVNEFFMKGARSLQIHFTGAPEKWKWESHRRGWPRAGGTASGVQAAAEPRRVETQAQSEFKRMAVRWMKTQRTWNTIAERWTFTTVYCMSWREFIEEWAMGILLAEGLEKMEIEEGGRRRRRKKTECNNDDCGFGCMSIVYHISLPSSFHKDRMWKKHTTDFAPSSLKVIRYWNHFVSFVILFFFHSLFFWHVWTNPVH